MLFLMAFRLSANSDLQMKKKIADIHVQQNHMPVPINARMKFQVIFPKSHFSRQNLANEGENQKKSVSEGCG